jgi:hypothetical protein
MYLLLRHLTGSHLSMEARLRSYWAEDTETEKTHLCGREDSNRW